MSRIPGQATRQTPSSKVKEEVVKSSLAHSVHGYSSPESYLLPSHHRGGLEWNAAFELLSGGLPLHSVMIVLVVSWGVTSNIRNP